MFRFVLKRLLLSGITIVVVTMIVFFMTKVLPGDVARQKLGRDASIESVEIYRKEQGLDKPLVTQYINMNKELLKGNLGISTTYEIPVSELLAPAATKSAQMALVAFIIIVPLSILGGILAAMKRGKAIDRIITVGGLSAAVIPEFVWSVLLILLFGVAIRAFPVSAFPDEGQTGIIQSVYHLILPSLALLFVLFGYISRITRAGVVEALESDYTRTAILKGHSRATAVRKHVLRNALLPTIAVVASQIPYLVGGLVAVELVFNYPGFGSLLLEAVSKRDFPMLQSAVILTGTVIISFQLIADVLFAFLNPRIRQRTSE